MTVYLTQREVRLHQISEKLGDNDPNIPEN